MGKDPQVQQDMSMSALLERMQRLEERNAQLEGVQKTLIETRSSTSQHISNVPELRDTNRLQAFLSEESSVFEYFSTSENFHITLRRGEQHFGQDGQIVLQPDLILRFRPYKGPGSEIPNPSKPTEPRFIWGFVDLRNVPEVTGRHISAEDLAKALENTSAFLNGTVFTADRAKQMIRPEFDYIMSRRRADAEMEQIRSVRPAGAFKGGLPVSLPV